MEQAVTHRSLGSKAQKQHMITLAIFYRPRQVTRQPRFKRWGNRVYLKMRAATKSYCKGLDPGRHKELWPSLQSIYHTEYAEQNGLGLSGTEFRFCLCCILTL